MTADVVPIDAAVEALLGVMRQGRRDEARLDAARTELEQVRADLTRTRAELKKARSGREAASSRSLDEASGRELAHELRARVGRRLHRG